MNSLRRMLRVLDLYRGNHPLLEVEEICSQLGYAPATAYRYVRELCAAGLLSRLPGGYALGPRVIELDRQMRDYDPVLTCSRDLLESMATQTGLNVLLSEVYGEKVINVHQQPGLDAQQLRFGRGRPFALFRSATARAILAHLPPRQLRRLYDANAQHPDVLRLGADWKAFSRTLLQIRKAGYCMTVGELFQGRSGIAAPLFDEQSHILGSITLVGTTQRFLAFNERYLAELIVNAAQEISRRIAAGTPPKNGISVGRAALV